MNAARSSRTRGNSDPCPPESRGCALGCHFGQGSAEPTAPTRARATACTDARLSLARIAARGTGGHEALAAAVNLTKARKGEYARGQAREIRDARCRSLSHRCPLDGHTNHVGLELHELVVARGSAIDKQPLARRAAREKSVDDVGDLVGDRGSQHMRTTRA
jgi:hypothetical protein